MNFEAIGGILHRISAADLLAAGLLFLTALGSALFAYFRTAEHRNLREFADFVFPREFVTHPSARADFLFWITRKTLMPLLSLPAGITFVVAVAYATNKALGAILHIDGPVISGPAGPATVVIFSATMLLAYDISYYLYHLAQHRIPMLWELHKVHHSAEVMVGITKDRVHPLDELMNRAWDGIIPGICFGIWSLFSMNLVEVTIFGINVYVMRNILMMDFVRHTHLKISFGFLNNLILCPHWHQLHHSTAVRHYDKNFGLLFSFWDRMFGTLCVPEPNESFNFGLTDSNARQYQSLFGLYLLPIKLMWQRATHGFRGGTMQGSASDRDAQALLSQSATNRIEIVRSGERLAAIEPAWTKLWHKTDGLVFQSHAWISAWWDTVPDRDRRQLQIGLIWRGDRLDAVLPLATLRRRGFRVLEWAAKSHSDYCDILIAPECRPSEVALLWSRIWADGGFDLVYLNRLLPDAAAHRLIGRQTDAPGKLRPNHRNEISYRVAGPWKTGAAWFDQQSKKTRQNYRRGRKFLEETGSVQFRLLSPDEPLQPVLDRVAEFKRKWLASHGHESDLFDEGSTALLSLVTTLARAGLLHIFVLECSGAVIAVSINFVQRGSMMAFVTTYDSAFERGSPGTVLMMDYIQWSIDHGMTTVDFLCGGEDFKRRFATHSVALESLLGARTIRGYLASFTDSARHAADRAVRQLQNWSQPQRPKVDAAI